MVSPEWNRCNGKQAVTHIWNRIPSSLQQVCPIELRMNHFPWNCRTRDRQTQPSPSPDVAPSHICIWQRANDFQSLRFTLWTENVVPTWTVSRATRSVQGWHWAELLGSCSYSWELGLPGQGSQTLSPSQGWAKGRSCKNVRWGALHAFLGLGSGSATSPAR